MKLVQGEADPHILVLIQARMGSTRFPGKSMAPLAGIPLIEHVVKRAHASEHAHYVCVATTDQPEDDVLAAHVGTLHNTGIYRGSSHDVLGRFASALLLYPYADCVVRLTADDYAKDPALIDHALMAFGSYWAEPHPDLGSPHLVHLGGPTWAVGMDVEVMSRHALERAAREATDPYDREHVTPWIAREMRCWMLKDDKQRGGAHIRLTMDTVEDFALATKIYDRCYSKNPVFDYKATLKAVAAVEQHT